MPAVGIFSSSSSFSSDASTSSFSAPLKMPSTDPSLLPSTTTTSFPMLRHRHHRVRPPPPPPSASEITTDLIHDQNDTVLIPPTNYRKSQQQQNIDTEKIKNTFAGGIFGRTSSSSASHPAGQSLASVFLLIFVLIGIVMILMLFYFLAKVCNGPDEERKDGKIKTKNGTIIIKHHDRKSDKIEVIPSKVPYPKRIYELQAEEGYYSCPPSISQSLQDIFGDSDDEIFGNNNNSSSSLPPPPPATSPSYRSRSVDDEESGKQKSTPTATQFVRKMTAAGLPPNFKPKGRLQELQNK